jgi:hypothetical protein
MSLGESMYANISGITVTCLRCLYTTNIENGILGVYPFNLFICSDDNQIAEYYDRALRTYITSSGKFADADKISFTTTIISKYDKSELEEAIAGKSYFAAIFESEISSIDAEKIIARLREDSPGINTTAYYDDLTSLNNAYYTHIVKKYPKSNREDVVDIIINDLERRLGNCGNPDSQSFAVNIYGGNKL